MSSVFPSLEEVVATHDLLIAQFGGSTGLRDQGALDSAILRPQLGYYHGIVEEAAAMMESLAMNYPFVDGNKRTAFFVTDAFLRDNGYFIDRDNDEAHAFFMSMFETSSFRFAQLKTWLEEYVTPLAGGGYG